MRDSLRVDVVLHRLRITRSRSEAKAACDAGAVSVGGAPVRASHAVATGDRILIRFPRVVLELELLELPGTSLSKQAARELYRLIGREPAAADA